MDQIYFFSLLRNKTDLYKEIIIQNRKLNYSYLDVSSKNNKKNSRMISYHYKQMFFYLSL